MAMDIKTLNFASYLNDQGMLYSTDVEHIQTLDRHKITYTVIIHPDPSGIGVHLITNRHIRTMIDTSYFDSGMRDVIMNTLQLAFPSQWIKYEAEVASA